MSLVSLQKTNPLEQLA